MYLVVDSKNPDFQLVHVDVLNGWGLAFKFNFISDTEFEILEAKHIIAHHIKPIEYPIKDIKKSEPDNTTNTHGYKLSVEIYATQPSNHSRFDRKVENNAYRKKKTLHSESPGIEHLIDVHISNKPKKNNLTEITSGNATKKVPKVDFGTEFCKFYIV